MDPVPAAERSGRARDLFALWFSSNLNVGNAVFGLVIYGIVPDFWLAVTATVTGNIIGTALVALHSVQGARLGIPQLIQSRGQFGYFGALVPVATAALMYAGFTASVTIGSPRSFWSHESLAARPYDGSRGQLEQAPTAICPELGHRLTEVERLRSEFRPRPSGAPA